METYRRRIDIEVAVEGRVMRTRSRMEDEYHAMELELTVDLTTKTISGCTGKMEKHPYAVCPGATAALARAVGLEILPGVKKAYRQAVPKSAGCAHFTEIVDNTMDFLLQKIYWDGVGIDIDDRGQHESRLFGLLNESDTCFAFNKARGFKPTVSDFLPPHPEQKKKG